MGLSASAESDDAPDRVVGRDTYCHAVTRNNFDSEAAHAAAELCEHFMALIALHAVQTAAVDRYDRALHIDQIVLPQIKDCATFGARMQTARLQCFDGILDLPRQRRVIVARQRHRPAERTSRMAYRREPC